MNSGSFNWELFEALPIVAILRGLPQEAVREVVQSLCRAGIVNIEITMNSPDAAEQIRQVAAAGLEINLGAGTVCSSAELKQALEAGASYIITPGLFPEVISDCKSQSIPVFAGAFSPTEVFHAWELGADIVKVFPASVFGPGYLANLRGPFPQIKLMPTGGVSPEKIEPYRKAGAVAFGVGGNLFNEDDIRNGRWESITTRAKEYVSAWQASS